MATGTTSNRCSICQKSGGLCMCGGCQKFFCVKHFNEHRQQLSIQFDRDVVRTHDELLEQIRQPKQPNHSADDLFSQIDRWEKTMIDKIHNTAEKVRHELTQILNLERETLTKQFGTLTAEVRRRREEDDFAEDSVKHLHQQINQLKQSFEQLTRPNNNNNNKVIVVENDQIDWNRIIYAQTQQQPASTRHLAISASGTWKKNGTTVAGGHGDGNGLNQLSNPGGLHVDDDQTIVVADFSNHRIVEWKCGATTGQVVAGGNEQGNRNDQLCTPTAVIIDKETDCLIICDWGNRRVVRWPHRGGRSGETIISDVRSFGLVIDDKRFLYVSDFDKHEVRRWRMGKTHGTLVAGGNGEGQRLDQLNHPAAIFVDRDHSVYVSDYYNHRVMKWAKDAKEGIVVAGDQGQGNALTQLNRPAGVIVDQLGTVYVADCHNHRIMRWPKGATQGSVVVDGNGQEGHVNQLYYPVGLSFDRHGNLYVADKDNHRVQRFSIVHR